MAEIQIEPAHQPLLARLQHVLEWLQSERQRLASELALIEQAGQREQQKLTSFLHTTYGIDLEAGVQMDADNGTIRMPDPAPASPASSPTPATTNEPAEADSLFLNRDQ